MNKLIRCSKCRKRKPSNDFHHSAARPNGRQRWCKVCTSANRKAYYQKHRERLLSASKIWIEKNRARFNANKRLRWKTSPKFRSYRCKLQRSRTARLTSGYVRGIMRWPDAPPEFVELKRLQIALMRKLKSK